MKPAKPVWILIILLAVLRFSLPFLLVSPDYELHRDEFLYYQQGYHFDLSYLENPPLIGYLARISSFFQNSEFMVKIWPGLFGAATLVICCLITALLGGRLFAQLLTGLSLIIGAFMRIHFLFQPNAPDIFFWTLSFYFIIRYIHDPDARLLFGLFISLALGCWSKYSIIFPVSALLLSLLMSKHRILFTKKEFYAALLCFLLIILPLFWWQYNHRFPLIHHMRELQETQLQFLSPLDFLKDQLLMLFPVLPVWAGGLTWLFREKQWRFLANAFLLVLILLILGRGKSYYSLGIYPVVLAAGAVAWEHWSERKIWIRPVLAGVIIILTIAFIPLLLPVWEPPKLAAFYQKTGIAKTGLLKWEDQQNHSLPQDFADMLGWKELAQKSGNLFSRLPDSVKTNTVIYCRHYGQAGALKFYGTNPSFRNRVITENGSFLLWIPESLWFKNLIYIGRDFPDKSDSVFLHFKKVTLVDSVSNPYSRQQGDKIILFEEADQEAWIKAREGLKKMKNRFRR